MMLSHRHNMVADFDICDALADALNDTTSLVAENDRESAFRILAGKRVGVLAGDEEAVRQPAGKLDADPQAKRTVWQRPE